MQSNLGLERAKARISQYGVYMGSSQAYLRELLRVFVCMRM